MSSPTPPKSVRVTVNWELYQDILARITAHDDINPDFIRPNRVVERVINDWLEGRASEPLLDDDPDTQENPS